MKRFALLLIAAMAAVTVSWAWTADNGNGTYTNPLFYDEFSDPDIIRVGDEFYLAGTTMHCVPGLVVLRSPDLVNWDLASYCFDRFDIPDDQFSLTNGKEAYGQGIWAPCIRYHDGKFYIFSNINGIGLQVYIADNPEGPWQHINMGGNIYDLSVLFDDDGKIYAVHGYDEVKTTEIKPDFSGYVEGSERVIIPRGNAMGEGHHIYKINGKYYILSADYAPMGRMQCARADKIEGPYETRVISMKETLGTEVENWVNNVGLGSPVPEVGFQFDINTDHGDRMGCATLHQGGLVDTPEGEWWGVTMQDFRGVGRTVGLSPVTWVDAWPYFGLEGNLGRTPRTWTKPINDPSITPHDPYVRSDNFDGGKLQRIWQWNHNPVEKKWTVTKQGKLRLNTMPADQFLWAKNTLTQRAVGPVGSATVEIDAAKLKDGDITGLALLNMPYSYIAIEKADGKFTLKQYDQNGNTTVEVADIPTQLWLRVTCDLDNEKAQYSYSLDGSQFQNLGQEVVLAYQLKTFQGSRYSLFAYNQLGKDGGYAEFDNFVVDEPLADRSANLPIGKVITLTNLGNGSQPQALHHGLLHSGAGGKDCQFRVHDRGNGKVALEAMNGTGFLTVVGAGLSGDVRLMPQESEGSLWMWQDMLRGDCMLLSMVTNRYLGIDPDTGEPYSADWPGANPNRRNGTVFHFQVTE